MGDNREGKLSKTIGSSNIILDNYPLAPEPIAVGTQIRFLRAEYINLAKRSVDIVYLHFQLEHKGFFVVHLPKSMLDVALGLTLSVSEENYRGQLIRTLPELTQFTFEFTGEGNSSFSEALLYQKGIHNIPLSNKTRIPILVKGYDAYRSLELDEQALFQGTTKAYVRADKNYLMLPLGKQCLELVYGASVRFQNTDDYIAMQKIYHDSLLHREVLSESISLILSDNDYRFD